MASNRAVLKEKRPQIATQGHYGDLEVIRVDVTARAATFQAKNTNYEETVALSTIRPLTEEDSGKFWELLVADLMRVLRIEAHYPPFVKGYEVETGEDSTGDPALYITIFVSPEQKYSHATVPRRNSFSNILLDRLLGLRLQRYPYVRVGEKRKRQTNGLARRSARASTVSGAAGAASAQAGESATSRLDLLLRSVPPFVGKLCIPGKPGCTDRAQ